MREALTVVGFLFILAFAALFAAPLYVDWNDWRDDIAQKLTQHFGTPVFIKGPISARLLPQPWLSLGEVTIGDPQKLTKLTLSGIDGDVSLGGLLRGDIDLSNVVVRSPELTIATDDKGLVEPLTDKASSLSAAVESFEVQDGSLHYLNRTLDQDLTLTGINLVGESGSVFGPYKAEGGVQFAGVPHTVKLSTGVVDASGLHVRLSAVPADKPVTIDLEGQINISAGKPAFSGNAALIRPAFGGKATAGNQTSELTPWRLSGPVTITPAGLASDEVALQIGEDERALKFDGKADLSFGPEGALACSLSGGQVVLDRFAGLSPDQREPPAEVLTRVFNAMPGLGGLPGSARLNLSIEGLLLGGESVRNFNAGLQLAGGRWQVNHLDADLPGRAHVQLKGGGGSGEAFKGDLSLQSQQATALIGWLQGTPVRARADAARLLSLESVLSADADTVALSGLTLGIDKAKVKGNLAWKRLDPGRSAGRIEADLSAERIDLDALPSVAALLPGGSDIFSEADVKLSAQALSLAGIEAKSVSGHVKAGGKLIALEDVVVNDLGGANLTANGRIDNIGAQPQGEIRVVLNGHDLTGLATALKRSSLPALWVDAFAARAAALSPANASLAIAFGASRQYSVDGKFGGSVIQFDTELSGEGDGQSVDVRLKADSLDTATLLRQMGLHPSLAASPGRASLEMALAGPLNAAMRWNATWEGAGVSISGTGKMTGPFEAPAFDGRLTAGADDVLVPAQIFGVAMPGVAPAQSASLDTGFRARAGRVVMDDVSGTALGMPFSGALSVEAGHPARIEGRLAFMRADGQILGSLFSGADLGGGNANGNAFAEAAFGASALDAIVGRLNVSAGRLSLSRRLPDVEQAKASLVFDGGKVNVDDFSAALAGGAVQGALQLSHAGLDTAASGRFQLQNVRFDSQSLTGTLNAALDFQGTGNSPDALMSSLTGGGTLEFRDPILAGLSPDAFSETVAAVDAGLPGDAAHVKPALTQALTTAPLATGTIAGNLSLAGGVLRLAAVRASAPGMALALSGQLDLSDMTIRSDLALTPSDPADGFGGPAPTIPVEISGSIENPRRDVKVSAMAAWLSIRGAEQQARKLEQLEAQRRAEEKAQDDARRAEAEQMLRAIDEARRKAQQKTVLPLGGTTGASPSLAPPEGGAASSHTVPSLPGGATHRMPSLGNLPGLLSIPGSATTVPPMQIPKTDVPTVPDEQPSLLP